MQIQKHKNTYVHYDLIRSGQLSPQELALLTLITSHSGYCLQTAATLGRQMQRCERTVRRHIDSLVAKGIITKKYTVYKKMILKIVDKASQILLAGTKSVGNMLSNLVNKSTYRTDDSSLHRTESTQPSIKKTYKENSLGKFIKKIEGKAKSELELARFRDLQVMQLQNQLNLAKI